MPVAESSRTADECRLTRHPREFWLDWYMRSNRHHNRSRGYACTVLGLSLKNSSFHNASTTLLISVCGAQRRRMQYRGGGIHTAIPHLVLDLSTQIRLPGRGSSRQDSSSRLSPTLLFLNMA